MRDLIKRGEAVGSPDLYHPRSGAGYTTVVPPDRPRRPFLAIRKRKWQILSICLGVTVPVALYCYLATPLYRSTARIQVDPEKELLSDRRSEPSDRNFESYLKTQYEILRSPSIARRVIERLLIRQSPERPTQYRVELGDNLFSIARRFSTTPAALQRANDLGNPNRIQVGQLILIPQGPDRPDLGADSSSQGIFSDLSTSYPQLEALWSSVLYWYHQLQAGRSPEAEFLSRLQIEAVTGSRMIEVSYTTPDPELAAATVNTLAEEFVRHHLEKSYEQAERTSQRLEGQLRSLAQQVKEAEADLVRYAREHSLTVNVGDRNITQDRLGQLNEELTKVQHRMFSTQAHYNALREATPSQFPQSLKTPVIERLETRVFELERQLNNLSSRFGANWPEVIEARGEVEQVRQQLRQEKEATIAHALRQSRLEYEAGRAEYEMLSSALKRQEDLANRLNEAAIQYNILQGDLRTKKQLYEDVLRRLEESRMVAGLKFENIHLVDPGQVPTFPYRPRTALNLSVALISGLLLGLGWAFLRERLDRTIKTPDELEERIGVPALAAIPKFKRVKLETTAEERRLLPGTSGLTVRKPRAKSEPVARLSDSQWKLWEAYRSLRTAILLSKPDQPPQTILMTSAVPQEGKTATVSHMGVVLAQTGLSTLLLDLDLRKPTLARQFGLTDDYPGSSVFLSGNSDRILDIRETEFPNLFILPSGPKPPNPAELMASERMRVLLEHLSQRFEYILIDSPPVLTVTDAQVLAPQVDGVVLVVRAGETPEEIVRRAASVIRRVGGRLLGAAINHADFSSPEYTYYERYCYDETYFR